jgi:hypothetical protein
MKHSACVYIARSGDTAVVVTMNVNEDGIWYEDEQARVLDGPLTGEELGAAVAGAMRSTARKSRNLRTAKMTDWPAYRASGAKSVRAFEEQFIYVAVEGANDANLVAVVTGSPEKGAELQVTSSVSTAFPANMGERILRVYEACRDRIV